MIERVGTPITQRVYAGPYEQFAPEAFEKAVGKPLTLAIPFGRIPNGVVLAAAKVAEDGSYADLTFDLPRFLREGEDG